MLVSAIKMQAAWLHTANTRRFAPLSTQRTLRKYVSAHTPVHSPLPTASLVACGLLSKKCEPGVSIHHGCVIMQGLLEGRKVMEDQHPVHVYTIAGVTFNGRQEFIRQLQPDQIVYLEREPWNQYDSFAVRIMDLSGHMLGYIPRRCHQQTNAKFAYDAAFGLIASTGLAKGTSYCGARLYARPKLASLMLDPLVLPCAESARLVDLKTTFDERWPALQATTMAAASYRCEVTGLGPEQTRLELTPYLHYNTQHKTIQLTRLIVLCKHVKDAKQRLERGITLVADRDATAATEALQELQATADGNMFTEINALADMDAIQYFELARQRARILEVEKWRVEVLL